MDGASGTRPHREPPAGSCRALEERTQAIGRKRAQGPASGAPGYEALLLDVDGTLLGDDETIHEDTLAELRRIRDEGIHVMIATGRSETAAIPVLKELELDTPALVYNGAALYCPGEERLVEERLLSDRTVERAMRYARERDLMTLTQVAGAKFTLAPRDGHEAEAIEKFTGIHIVPTHDELPREFVIRLTLLSSRHSGSAQLGDEIQAAVDQPLLLTHFPLSALAQFRSNVLDVCDLQPPCLGKSEAFRVLQERWGIPSHRRRLQRRRDGPGRGPRRRHGQQHAQPPGRRRPRDRRQQHRHDRRALTRALLKAARAHSNRACGGRR